MPDAFPVVCLGASAGGADALGQLLAAMPERPGAAFLVVQHLDPSHRSRLSEALAKATSMRVVEARDGVRIVANRVYVTPAAKEISFSGETIRVRARAARSVSPYHPIDETFISLARAFGERAVGVVLSGRGHDGTEGLRAIRASGGFAMAQSPATARQTEMPQSAIAASVVDVVLPPRALGRELARHPSRASARRKTAFSRASLEALFSAVASAVSVDLSAFRESTVRRRLARRLTILDLDVAAYTERIRADPAEGRMLVEDLLIHVTEFFRDREILETLARDVLQPCIESLGSNDPMRVWVAGCSTGEEAYSLGMILLELADGRDIPIQIFGTDLSARAIATARAGVYSERAMAGVDEARRARFFDRDERGHCAKKVLRELCVFAQHDLTRDPPFGRLHFVSCRNVLMYLGVATRRALLPRFHRALVPGGVLLLGRAETVAPFQHLFTPIDASRRLFSRSDASPEPARPSQRRRAGHEISVMNEELASTNAQLVAANEELEATREELESTNEELITLNDELQVRNRELAIANTDLANLLTNVDVCVVIIGPDRRVRRFTPAATRVMSLRSADLGRSIDDVRTELRAPRLGDWITDVLTNGVAREEVVLDTAGHYHRLQLRPYRTAGNRNDGAVLCLVDVDELQRTVRDSGVAREAAESANRAKDQFLATLSHELRTPLSALLMQAQLLQLLQLDPGARSAAQAIERAAMVQARLVDDLLDVSRIGTGKLELHRRTIDLVAPIERAVDLLRDVANDAGVALVVNLEAVPAVRADETRIQQVVWNLVSNAIRFTEPGGSVRISLRKAGDAAVVLEVKDSGRGVDPAFLPRLFERFTQAEQGPTRGHGGLGVGLSIVKALVEAHGGDVQVESGGLGAGTTARVTLPVAPAMAKQKEPERRPVRLDDLRVLVVDDDDGGREAAASLLRHCGAVVATAESADAAIDALERAEFDVVLCDIAMPREDGCSLLVRARETTPHARSARWIALTAHASRRDEARLTAAGFVRHVGKPVDGAALASIVRAVSRGTRKRRA